MRNVGNPLSEYRLQRLIPRRQRKSPLPLIGRVMKQTRGRADAQVVRKILKDLLAGE
ncbi:MAG: hypothetical protein GTO55_09450 [Armatimonadetes bacterium]|nr:hypothetical protein [Armatimonadota bacterium]NIM24472.1 hypothetical protein [Armatimonadota bacterium]NIM68343.1 hypothetical protein [Armatimonadota bacterium]NIM76747.1 hypothetical protein [Armatimonadota bacterium]NIN06546.1 hypothetical protein [Armatimonadota bacterium]